MINFVQNYFLRKNLESLKPLPIKQFSGNNIGILFNADRTDKDQLQQLIKKNFGVNSSQISFLGYSKHNYGKTEKPTFIFTQKDFTLYGKPNSEPITVFLNQNYKLLFNFFGENELCLENVAKLTQAKLKVGLSESNDKINDLLLALDSKNLDFFKESSKYIKHII